MNLEMSPQRPLAAVSHMLLSCSLGFTVCKLLESTWFFWGLRVGLLTPGSSVHRFFREGVWNGVENLADTPGVRADLYACHPVAMQAGTLYPVYPDKKLKGLRRVHSHSKATHLHVDERCNGLTDGPTHGCLGSEGKLRSSARGPAVTLARVGWTRKTPLQCPSEQYSQGTSSGHCLRENNMLS